MHIVLPVAYFPPISWMALFLKSDVPLLEIHETYPKQTLRNRCIIMAANGKLRLTVPVKKPHGSKTRTGEIMVDHQTPWAIQHLRSLSSAYNKTPYFFHFEDDIANVLLTPHKSLFELNTASLALIFKMMRISRQWRTTDSFSGLSATFRPALDNLAHTYPSEIQFPVYMQAFSDRHGFLADLSVLDLIFNVGPAASVIYLSKLGDMLIAKESSYSG